MEERAGRRVAVVRLGMPRLHDLDFHRLSQGASQAVAGPLTGFQPLQAFSTTSTVSLIQTGLLPQKACSCNCPSITAWIMTCEPVLTLLMKAAAVSLLGCS